MTATSLYGLVRDPATGRLVCDAGSGHLVYSKLIRLTVGGGPVSPRYKVGEDSVWATALTEMENSSWLPHYDTRLWALCYHLFGYYAACSYYPFNIESHAGETITGLSFWISSVVGTTTWRLFFTVAGSDISTWAGVLACPSVTGTTTGYHVFTFADQVLSTGFNLVMTLHPYPTPAVYPDPGHSVDLDLSKPVFLFVK